MSLCRVVEYDPIAFEPWCAAEAELRNRAPKFDSAITESVSSVLRDIQSRGVNAALAEAKKYDCSSLSFETLGVTDKEYEEASATPQHLSAIRESIARVTEFHQAQLAALTSGMESIKTGWQDLGKAWQWTIPVRSGAQITGYEGQRLVPLANAGVYVPGGKASYPSTVIMNAVPATVSGIAASNVSICTPARKDGSVHPALIVAARELGIRKIAKVGGAAAIGFLALGDRSEQPWRFGGVWGCNSVIVGPGNAWVNEAKRQLWGRVGLDTYAGPSEVCVVVDDSANASFAAADWLAQVEHSEDNVGVIVATSRKKAEEIFTEAERQLKGSPREQIVRSALRDHGIAFVCATIEEACALACSIRAEHVTLMVEQLEEASRSVLSGGCIALGDYTPQSAGDFVSGPSHTLPTAGAARFASPVNVMTFLKFQSISKFTKEDLAELQPTIEAFAEMEGFPLHGRGASIRFEKD